MGAGRYTVWSTEHQKVPAPAVTERGKAKDAVKGDVVGGVAVSGTWDVRCQGPTSGERVREA